MQSSGLIQTSNAEIFLLGALLNIIITIDYPALTDYAIRAAIGGVIYILFKILADYISEKFIVRGRREWETNCR